jgi:hypothetical protein
MSFKAVSQTGLWRALLVAVCPLRAQAEEPAPPAILLWQAGAPLAQGTADEDQPKITVYLPKAAPGKAAVTKTAVVVCPGGACAVLAMDHEGKQVARGHPCSEPPARKPVSPPARRGCRCKPTLTP